MKDKTTTTTAAAASAAAAAAAATANATSETQIRRPIASDCMACRHTRHAIKEARGHHEYYADAVLVKWVCAEYYTLVQVFCPKDYLPV